MITNGCKKCYRCQERKTVDNFWKCKSYTDGLSYRCKTCDYIIRTEYASKNRDKINATRKKLYYRDVLKSRNSKSEFYYKNRDLLLNNMRKHYAKLKSEIFEAYGNKCSCCGVEHKEFLCVDHIGGGGCKDRKSGPAKIYTRIRREGFPKDKYRLLCHNCNMSIGFYGYCPHNPEVIHENTTGRPKAEFPKLPYNCLPR